MEIFLRVNFKFNFLLKRFSTIKLKLSWKKEVVSEINFLHSGGKDLGKLSILITIYNKNNLDAAFLNRLLKSCVSQMFSPPLV